MSPESEHGFGDVHLTAEGEYDPLFRGLDATFEVFQWHGDMFHIPQGGELLALSKACPHQAFRVGECAYGLQYHVEITGESIQTWCERNFDLNEPRQKARANKMIRDYQFKQETFIQTAQTMYNNFLEIILREKDRNAENRVSPAESHSRGLKKQ